MFSNKIKPDYRVPGLNYEREAGLLKGKLYTTFFRRFKSGGWNAFKAGFYSFILIWILLWIIGDRSAGSHAAISAFAIGFISYPVFIIYDPGIRIEISKDEFKIGRRRYDLNEMSSFYKIPYRDENDKISGYCAGFRYGEKEIEIPVFNKVEVIEGIVPFLNREREAVQREFKLVKQTQEPKAETATPGRMVEF